MSQELVKIKRRIKSVSGALKVTSAMKLVSAVKLKRWKSKMIANKEYCNHLEEVVSELFNYISEDSSFYQANSKSNKKLFIIVSSTLGLCGSYNLNIFKLADVSIKENDDAIILGNKGIVHYSGSKFTQLPGYESYTSVDDSSLVNSISSYALNEFKKGTYKEIHLIYSQYKNSLVFMAKDSLILPLTKIENSNTGYGPLLEPNKDVLIDTLVPIYIKTTVFSRLLESEVCEQASRNNAMENATNNANEILDSLQLEFNKARQASITQEITEIVGASNAR